MQYTHLLMDLDGTVTDPAEGITRSVQYALSYLGIEVKDLHELWPFIGPPLKDSFREFYQLNDAECKEAIAHYREYFSTRGIFQNKVYVGMEFFLRKQCKAGRQLYLATSKPEPFARRILTHFGLDIYFSFVGGSTLEGERSSKEEVIRWVLDTQQIKDLSRTVMIGDRRFDVEGASLNGLDSIGVLYGYGSREELVAAGATYLVADVASLTAQL